MLFELLPLDFATKTSNILSWSRWTQHPPTNSACSKLRATGNSLGPTSRFDKQYHNVASNYLKYYIIYHLTYNHLYIIEFNIDPSLKSDLYLETIFSS